MNAIEAVARAWYEAEYKDRHMPDFATWIGREGYLSRARAALTALRDNGVTEGMVKSGWECVTNEIWANHQLREAFRAMLDAALEGE